MSGYYIIHLCSIKGIKCWLKRVQLCVKQEGKKSVLIFHINYCTVLLIRRSCEILLMEQIHKVSRPNSVQYKPQPTVCDWLQENIITSKTLELCLNLKQKQLDAVFFRQALYFHSTSFFCFLVINEANKVNENHV